MAVESDADRAAVLDDFGVTVIIGGTTTITCIFDNGFSDELGNWVTTPILTARTIDISSYARGQALAIDGVAYTIADSQPDGQGITTVILQKV